MDRSNIKLRNKTILIMTNKDEIPIKAELAFTMYDHRFYIHRAIETNYNPRWRITEYKTGCYIAQGNSKKEAISNAKKLLEQKGKDGLLEALKDVEIINKG